MNHLETYQMEVFVSKSESDWLVWAQQAETLLGHSLDGDQIKDGYSIDYAYEVFEGGVGPEQFAAWIKSGMVNL